MEASLAFLNQIKEIDQIICGINNVRHLEEQVKALKADIIIDWLFDFGIDDKNILRPGNWK